MTELVLYSKASQEITQEWLERNVPRGTTVRAIPLPGFMLHDDRSSVSVQAFPPEQGAINIERLRTMRGRRPPELLLAELATRPLVVKVNLVKDERDERMRHPIARSITKALHALVESNNRLFDEDFTDLSGSFTLPSSGAPPYDPTGPVDYRSFVFDYFWYGHVDVPWLRGKVGVIVYGAVEPIPLAQRRVLERVCTLPESIRDSLEKFLFDRLQSKEFRRMQLEAPTLATASDIWRFVSRPTINVPEESRAEAYFDISFECAWDEEHGISVLFDDRARPIKLGGQGDFSTRSWTARRRSCSRIWPATSTRSPLCD